MPAAPLRSRVRALTSGALVAAAIGIMNVTTYGLTLLTARLMGPSEFGQFSSVLGLLIVVNVVSLGLQATAARRISTNPAATRRIIATISRATYTAAVGILGLTLALTPAVRTVLDLTSWWSAIMMAVAAAFLTVMGGLAGLLQGAERWAPLSVVYTVMGVARLALGGGALLIERTTAAAMTGVAVGAALPALVAWWAVRALATEHAGVVAGSPPVGAEPEAVRRPFGHRPVLREVSHSTQALFAFFALSNADIVLARVVLPDHDSGLYAAGLILTKAVLFLPQFVVIVAFPAMARNRGGRRTHVLGLGLVLALGSLACLVIALLADLALVFVGGSAYAEVGPHLWLFAVLGTILAMIQLLVYSALAQGHGQAVIILWAGLAVMVSAGLLTREVLDLLSVKLGADTLVLVVMFVVLLLRPGRHARAEVPEVAPPLAEDSSSPEQPAVR